VVTETLYALIKQTPSFIPSEVCLLTTREGAERAKLALLSEDPGWFKRFCRDYRLPAIEFDERSIHVLKNADGQPLEDIRTPEDNRQAADQICEMVRVLTADPESALHVSLAGGRKTMGYYLGYALSLYGRPQDRLSHVLVSEPFESSWEFFYPTPYERIIQTRNDKLADCAEAIVTLAEIPFVRLREGLPPRLLSGRAGLSEVVEAANRALEPPRLLIDLCLKSVWADDLKIDLNPTELALLLWLAERACGDNPHVHWQQASEAQEFLEAAKRVMNRDSGEYDRCQKALNERLQDAELLREYFEPHKSRIKTAFVETLGKTAASRYLIQRGGDRGRSYYYLPLEAAQIEIIEDGKTR
jgi:CRISPR-associated protein (TIGR02584 family)